MMRNKQSQAAHPAAVEHATQMALASDYSPLELAQVDRAPDGALARLMSPVSGELAVSAAKALSSFATSSAKTAGSPAGETLYRLAVTDSEMKKGLAQGTLRFATPGKGDASVLIKHVGNGRMAGSAKLVKAGGAAGKAVPGAGAVGTAAVAVPALAVVAATAVIMHQLKVMDAKLDALARDLGKVVKHLDYEQESVLHEAHDAAGMAARALDAGGGVSSALQATLHEEFRGVRRVWRQLHEKASDEAAGYADGRCPPENLLRSWMRLTQATQALCEVGEVMMRLPRDSVEDAELFVAEQQQLLTERVEEIRALAATILDAHLHWAAVKAEYDLARTLNPVKLAKRAVKRTAPRKPKQFPLDSRVAWQCGQLASPPSPTDAVLLEVGSDGQVNVAVEAHDEAGDFLALQASSL
jgi:hypothetical protein